MFLHVEDINGFPSSFTQSNRGRRKEENANKNADVYQKRHFNHSLIIMKYKGTDQNETIIILLIYILGFFNHNSN